MIITYNKSKDQPGKMANLLVVSFFSFFSLISLIADGPDHYHPACGHKGSSHLSPVHALHFFIAMQVQHSYNSSTNGWILLSQFPRFPLRKKEHKSYFGKNRTHDFRASRCAGYLLDHSGDEGLPLKVSGGPGMSRSINVFRLHIRERLKKMFHTAA